MQKPFVLCIWVVLFCHLSLASQKPCPKLVAREAPAVARTQFESVYPVYTNSLRAKFPRIHRQLLEVYETNSSILRFAQPGPTPEKITDLMDRMAEGSNAISRRMQKILNQVKKDLSRLESDLQRSASKRGSANQLSALRDQRDDLLQLQGLINMAAQLFRLGPADSSAPFGPGTQLKWDQFLKLRAEMDGQYFDSDETLSFVFAELSQDFRWAWALVRVGFCLPRLERVFLKSSDLGIRALVVGGQQVDRYLTMKFIDENGRPAIAELRSLVRPVLFGTENWAESLDAAEKLQSLGIQPRFKIHFFFTGGVDEEVKKVLEKMDITVHGPVVPSVDR